MRLKIYLFIFLLLLIKCSTVKAAEISISQNATYHFVENENLNHIGDLKTTLNKSLRITHKDYSAFIFNDSINSPAFGLSKKVWSFDLGERVNLGLQIGAYFVNKEAWSEAAEINSLSVANNLLIPVLSPEITIDLYKKDGLKIQSHTFYNLFYISSGIVLGFEF